MLSLSGPAGAIGTIMPSAFHANEGAAGIRRLYLRQTRLELCLSFENRRMLFDIHARYKFALIVARCPGPTETLRCRFYLSRFSELEEPHRCLTYDADFIRSSGGTHATLLELRGAADVGVARRMFGDHGRLVAWNDRHGITLSREIHMSDDAGKFVPVARLPDSGRRSYLTLHEGKTIHQFADRWDTEPRYAIAVSAIGAKQRSLETARYFRAACREIARSTDERTAIAAILPPGVLCGHTLNVERTPWRRTSASALILVAIMNSYAFDWLLRQKAAVHASLYLLADLPMPEVPPEASRLLAHASLRLCCNHRGFAALWREQLGDAWREMGPSQTWPAIASATDRWRARATMDAVVAHGYGLTRAEYGRILSGFTHKSSPAVPGLALAAFDALADQGLATFCRDRDPYAGIALVTTPAQPAIRLPSVRPLS